MLVYQKISYIWHTLTVLGLVDGAKVMQQDIIGFLTRDDFTNNNSEAVSDVLEISSLALSYARDKKTWAKLGEYKTEFILFKEKTAGYVTDSSADVILEVGRTFVDFLLTQRDHSVPEIIANYVSSFNLSHSYKITYLHLVTYKERPIINDIKAIEFTTDNGLDVYLFLSDKFFITLYPFYEIIATYPIENFYSLVTHEQEFVNALQNFSIEEFNQRMDESKGRYPVTSYRVINIPYLKSDNSFMPCYFGFVVYGNVGEFEDVLLLFLYDEMIRNGLSDSFIRQRFPGIFEINEFFVIPWYDKIAMEANDFQTRIYSQVTKTYSENITIQKYLPSYNTIDHIKNRTYNVPTEYNNILLRVVDGFYSKRDYRYFPTVYPDIVTISTTDMDFYRMSVKTRTMVETLLKALYIADSSDDNEMITKLTSSIYTQGFRYRLRNGFYYIAFRYNNTLFHVLPRHQYT